MVKIEVEVSSLRYVKESDDIDYDVSYLEESNDEKARKRLDAFWAGEWNMVGVYVEVLNENFAVLVRSGGLWNIESDSDQSYFNEVARDEVSELEKLLSLPSGKLSGLRTEWVER